jgi:hypothetical protein
MVDLLTPGALALSPAADPVDPAGALVPDDDEFLELLLHAAARPATAARAKPFFQNPPDLRVRRVSIEVPPPSGVRLCAAVDLKATDL